MTVPCTVKLPFCHANEKTSKNFQMCQLTAWTLLELLINLLMSEVDALLIVGPFSSLPSTVFTSGTYYTLFFKKKVSP